MENRIYHHGIKGQKWGVRRFQDLMGRWTVAGRERYGATVEKIAIASDKISARRFQEKVQHYYDIREFDTLKDVPKINDNISTDDSIKVVNKGYGADGTFENCAFVTVAMAMREKGYDVVANTMEGGLSELNVNTMFDKNGSFKQMDRHTTADDVRNTLSSFGDGAYGGFSVAWKVGGGHLMLWKNENGKTIIYDGQDSSKYDLGDSSEHSLMSYLKLDNIAYSRYDNAEPTELALAAVRRRH